MVYGQQSTAYKQTSRLLMASSPQFMASSSWPAVYDQLRVVNFRMLNTSARLTRVKRADLRIHLNPSARFTRVKRADFRISNTSAR